MSNPGLSTPKSYASTAALVYRRASDLGVIADRACRPVCVRSPTRGKPPTTQRLNLTTARTGTPLCVLILRHRPVAIVRISDHLRRVVQLTGAVPRSLLRDFLAACKARAGQAWAPPFGGIPHPARPSVPVPRKVGQLLHIPRAARLHDPARPARPPRSTSVPLLEQATEGSAPAHRRTLPPGRGPHSSSDAGRSATIAHR